MIEPDRFVDPSQPIILKNRLSVPYDQKSLMSILARKKLENN